MPSLNYRNLFLATLLLAGALLFAVADPGAGNVLLTLDQDDESLCAKDVVGGTGEETPGETVAVRMYVDGELVAEDEQMEGSVNRFAFIIPETAAGKVVTIEAESSTGGIVRHTFVPHPPRG